MNIIIKGRFFKVMHIWFENDLTQIGGGYDKLIVHGSPKHKLDNYSCMCSQQETLISNISLSEDELRSKLTKSVKNEINRAIKENVKVEIYRNINDELVNAFADMYTGMYESKGMMNGKLPIHELKAYSSNSSLVVTVALIDNKPVVYHSYVIDETHSRFLHSCSEFRIADKSMRNAIGRANKFLHWNDWMYLKSLGIVEYDWGGIHSYEEPNGIDEFKMSFGGEYRKYDNLSCDCSLRAKVVDKLKSYIKKRS